MQDYVMKPKPAKAVYWDGTRAQMYRVIGDILEAGGDAFIEDGYASQGPDRIGLNLDSGTLYALPNSYIVVIGNTWKVMDKPEFERDYEEAPKPPKPPVMRGSRTDEVDISR